MYSKDWKKTARRQPFRFSDLPESMRSTAQSALHDAKWLGNDLEFRFRYYFDVDLVSDLVRFSSDAESTEISLAASEEGRELLALASGDFGIGIHYEWTN